MVAPPVLPARSPAPAVLHEDEDDDYEELGDLMQMVSLGSNHFNPVDLGEKFLSIGYKTGFFSDGRQRAVRDYLVRSTHTDNFLVAMSSATSFVLKTRVPQLFLDALGRSGSEFDPNHHDTYVLIAGMRETVDIIAEEQGSDFDNVWSNGVQYQLPFKCNPNPNMQLIWHTGDTKLLAKRRNDGGGATQSISKCPSFA